MKFLRWLISNHLFPVATSQLEIRVPCTYCLVSFVSVPNLSAFTPCQISKLNLGSSEFYWSLILIGACFFQYTSLDILDSKIPGGDVFFGSRAVDAEINKTKLLLNT